MTLFLLSQSGPTVPPIDFDAIRFTLRVIDLVTIVYFSVEYIVRFTCAPKKLKFFFQVHNLFGY